jgi:alkylation response protein AidB-like acyl-CoA dehydrogenase
MDIRPSARQRDVAQRLDELFHPDLLDTLRRLGERPLGAGSPGALDDAEAGARASVWRVLCDLDIARLAVPGPPERHAALVTVAETMGRALYTSPLSDTAAAAEMIAAAGESDGLLASIGDGTLTVALALRDDGRGDLLDPPPMRGGVDGRTLDLRRRFVAFAADVDMLLVAGATPVGVALALVERDQPGVAIRRQDDITRGDLYAVTLHDAHVARWLGGVPGWPAGASAYAAAVIGLRLRQAAYLVGSARGALTLTVGYTKSREQFGQPVARFQAPAFRLAALHARIEAVGDLVQYGAWQADQGDAAASTTTMQALALAGDLARDAATEAVQLHGAYGMTERSDAQRFYRRAALDAIWADTPTVLRAALARRLAQTV